MEQALAGRGLAQTGTMLHVLDCEGGDGVVLIDNGIIDAKCAPFFEGVRIKNPFFKLQAYLGKLSTATWEVMSYEAIAVGFRVRARFRPRGVLPKLGAMSPPVTPATAMQIFTVIFTKICSCIQPELKYFDKVSSIVKGVVNRARAQ